LVHKWRSEEAAILVGTNTALLDNPELTTRLWTGPSPVRLILDLNLRLPTTLRIFNDAARTIIFNSIKHQEEENLLYYQLDRNHTVIHQMMNALYLLNIQSVLVEGGAKLLQSFIDERMWDEARVITGASAAAAENYMPAPKLTYAVKNNEMSLVNDKVEFFKSIADPDFTNE
ncbi:MAG: RibD family protein, partial [Chitinophagaceae bacterium]